VSLEMYMDAKIMYLRDALGGRDRANLGMHWEAKIK